MNKRYSVRYDFKEVSNHNSLEKAAKAYHKAVKNASVKAKGYRIGGIVDNKTGLMRVWLDNF